MPTLTFDGASLDLVIRQGKTFDPAMAWKDSAGGLVNLTGYTAFWVARHVITNTVLFSITQGAGITLGGTPNNILALISAATTATWTPGKYLHELELASAAGTRGFIQGKLTVLAETAK